MSRQHIRAALESRLASLTPAWPVAWENVSFAPVVGTPWMRARVLFGRTTALGFGQDAGEEWSGVLHVGIFTPAGKGPKAAEDRATLIRGDRAAGTEGLFFRGLNLFSSGVAVTCLQPYDGPPAEEPDWFSLPVLVPFSVYVL